MLAGGADLVRVIGAHSAKRRADAIIIGSPGPEHIGRGRASLPGFALGRQGQAGHEIHGRKLDTSLRGIAHREHVIGRGQAQRGRCDGTLRCEREIAVVHVGVGNQLTEMPQACDGPGGVSIDEPAFEKLRSPFGPRPAGKSKPAVVERRP